MFNDETPKRYPASEVHVNYLFSLNIACLVTKNKLAFFMEGQKQAYTRSKIYRLLLALFTKLGAYGNYLNVLITPQCWRDTIDHPESHKQ